MERLNSDSVVKRLDAKLEKLDKVYGGLPEFQKDLAEEFLMYARKILGKARCLSEHPDAS